MDTLLLRLVRDGKVVGYEKHEGGKILHSVNCKEWYDILTVQSCGIVYKPLYVSPLISYIFYIQHDRIDLYTGVDIDGVKVFYKDQISWLEDGVTKSGVVTCLHGGASVKYSDCSDIYRELWSLSDEADGDAKAKFIGIEGVIS